MAGCRYDEEKGLELAEDKLVRTLLCRYSGLGIVIVDADTGAGYWFLSSIHKNGIQSRRLAKNRIWWRTYSNRHWRGTFQSHGRNDWCPLRNWDQTIESLEEEGFDDIQSQGPFFISSILQRIWQILMRNSMQALWIVLKVKRRGRDLRGTGRLPFPIRLQETEKMEIQKSISLYQYGYSATDKMQAFLGKHSTMPHLLQLMQEATKYIGFPYQWGGSTRKPALTVPGFVCWVYTHSGVHNLPRTTAQQIYNQCTPVSKKTRWNQEIWVFTGTYQSSNPVTHIGIYVGDNQMLHCGDPIGYANFGEFLLGEAFPLWIWQIVKECEKYDERNYGRRNWKRCRRKEGIDSSRLWRRTVRMGRWCQWIIDRIRHFVEGDTFKMYMFWKRRINKSVLIWTTSS